MRSVVLGEGPHTGVRVSELRTHGDVCFLSDGSGAEEAVASSVADVVVLEDSGLRFFPIAAAAIRNGKHVLASFPRALAVADLRMLGSLAEEAGVRVSAGGALRMLPSLQAISIRRPRIVAIHAAAAGGPGFLDRLVDCLDLCLSLVDTRDVQKVDAESVRAADGGFAVLGASIRFQNGTLALIHQDRGPGDIDVSVGGDQGSERIALAQDAIREESVAAARLEVRTFLDGLAGLSDHAGGLQHTVQTLQLADHVIKRMHRRSVVTV